MRCPRPLVRALAVAVISAPTLFGCGGAPPEGEECVEPPAASAVGTISFALTDASRGEDATSAPDDHRELLVTAFYPAIEDPARLLAPCFRGEGEAALNAESWGLPPSVFEGPCGEARVDAEVAGTEPLPVLIFSHGYGMPIALYTSWLERLAGRGYLVLGVTHPYTANITVLPSGVIARSPEMPGALSPLIAGLSLDQRAVIAALRHAAPDSSAGRLAVWWDGAQVGVVGHSVGAATFSVVGFAAKSSRTLGEALERVARYSRLLNDAEEITLAREGRALVVGQNPRGAAPQWSRHKAEGAIANYVVLGRKWTGQPWSPLAVSFRHEAPGDVSEHRRIFQCPVRFGRERNELRIDLAVLDLPLQGAAPDLGDYLRRRADRLLALSSPKALLDDVRLAVREGLPNGHPDVATLARRLGTSARSLQRRLAEEGTTYATLVDEVRRDAALELLAERHVTVEEAAFLLGFADARGFRRAFERWTGRTLRGHRGAGGVRSA